MPSSDQTQSPNLTDLVENCTFGVSVVRMTDIALGFSGLNLFTSGTMLPNVIGVEITDSLGQYFKVAKIVLNDDSQLMETTPFTGNEVIAIRYKNKASDPSTGAKVLYFRIFDMQQLENFKYVNANPGAKFVVIHLVEFPAYEMFTTSSIYKTYPNNQAVISDVVFDSLKGINYIEKYYNISHPQKTKGTIDFWIPNWTLLKTFKYLQQYAVTQANEPFYVLTIRQDDMSTSSNALKNPTIHYESIFNRLKGVSNRTFSTVRSDMRFRDPNGGTTTQNNQNKTTPDASNDTNNDPQDVILGRMMKSYDGSMLFFGMNGETLVGRDAINGTAYFSATFEDFLKSYSGLGMWSAFQTSSNKKSWGNQWSSFGPSFLNQSSFDKNQVQSYYRNLYGKRLMLGSNRLVIYCYTNEFRNPGEKVSVMLPSSDKSSGIDLMNSGDWMIWSITDKITSSGRSVSEIELVRDSYFLIPQQRINNFIPNINTLSSNQQIPGT